MKKKKPVYKRPANGRSPVTIWLPDELLAALRSKADKKYPGVGGKVTLTIIETLRKGLREDGGDGQSV